MTDLIFLDTETTGLDYDKHQVWEIAWAVNDGPIEVTGLMHDLDTADAKALQMNGYYERAGYIWPMQDRIDLHIRAVLEGNTLVCSNPPFDRGMLKSRWQTEPWHHRSVDISSYAMPILGHDRPMGLARVADDLRADGWAIPTPDHSAKGDVQTLRACYRTLEEKAKRLREAYEKKVY